MTKPDHAITRDAEQAFWKVIAEAYPEITTGDLDPVEAFALMLAMERAVNAWVYENAPSS